MVNPTSYVSCIKQFRATVLIKKAHNVVKLQALIDRKKVVVTEDVIRHDLRLDDVDGVECLPNEEIFIELARVAYEKPPPKGLRGTSSVVQWRLLLFALQQARKGFSGVETPLFATMLVQTQPSTAEDEDEVQFSNAPTPPSPITEPSPPSQEPITTPPQAPPAPPSSLPQEQQTDM
nr:hypothetical protein [Tanacetum cinerariifolium]